MARYRKIEVRMWIDQKFRSLSAPPPNGRDCWIYLLTNPDTNAIPGVYRAREEAMARDLGWPLKGFREAFREVFEKGMAKADWEAGLVFIPNATKHNPPESPNVIKGWRSAWDELPECALKDEALRHLKVFAEDLPKGFQEVFWQVFGKSMPNQEQEQEQEQDKDSVLPIRASESEPTNARPANGGNGHAPALDFERLYLRYPRHEGKSRGLAICRKIKTPEEYMRLEAAIDAYATQVQEEGRDKKHIKQFSSFMGCWTDYAPSPEDIANKQATQLALAEVIRREREREESGEAFD